MTVKAKDLIYGFFTVIIWVYSLLAIGFAAYYNYDYAIRAGFVRWLLLGEIISTAKAIIWPYFVFVH